MGDNQCTCGGDYYVGGWCNKCDRYYGGGKRNSRISVGTLDLVDYFEGSFDRRLAHIDVEEADRQANIKEENKRRVRRNKKPKKVKK